MTKHYNSKPELKANATLVHTLQASLDLPLLPRQIPQFRGAVVEAMGQQEDLLHNHTADGGYHYRYPLIQYRAGKRQAGLYGIGEGATILRRFLLGVDSLNMGDTTYPLRISALQEEEHLLKMAEQPQHYRLYGYLPFNQQNYQAWQSKKNLVARIEMLEGTLVSHIFGFANALPFQLPGRLEVSLQEIQRMRPMWIHGHRRVGYDLAFEANVDLPDGIGLGRSVAFGFGVLRKRPA